MQITVELLIRSGFVPHRYEGQQGLFHRKIQAAENMPYVMEHIVDNDEVMPETSVVVEVSEENMVLLYIEDADYVEGPFRVDGEEGLALLKDAGLIEAA